MAGDDVLALIDEAGRVVEWGRPAEELFGWSAEEAVGRSVTAFTGEVAARDAHRRQGFPEAPAVLVKPVMRGSSVLWQVSAAGDTLSRPDMAVLNVPSSRCPVGLLVLDEQLRVIRMNSTMGGPGDAPVEELLGRPFSEAYELQNPEEEAAVARRVLESGEPVVNRLVRVARAPAHRSRRIYSVSYFRLEDAHGSVIGLVTSAADVTEQEHAHNRLALLDRVRTQVGHRLNVGVVCRELVEAVVPAFAGIAVVEVIEDVVRGEEPPPAPVDHAVPLRRAAFHGVISAYPVGDVRPLPSGTPFSRVLSDLRPCLVQIDEDCPWLAADPLRADSIERSGAHSLIVAPLALRGHVLGLVSFYRHKQEDPFEEADLEVAADVCAHAALCIDNARQYMREWVIASTVQRRLLPTRPAVQSTVDISPLHLPDPQGGSAWFDTIALPGARTALIVGEVPGQGIIAAITLGLLRTAIHTLAAMDLQPDELLARLNDTATHLADERAALPPEDPLHREPLTAGCTIAIYDPVDLTCAVACAGFPEPVAVLPDGSRSRLSVPQGPLLATTGNAPFPMATVDLPEGSTLVLGTVPIMDEVLAPSASLHPLLGGPDPRPLPGLRDSIASALTRGPRSGETMFLLARTSALPPDRVLTRSLPAGPEAAPIARAAARRQVEEWGIDQETAFTTELIVSELIGNAVRYGTSPFRLRLILDRMLTCEVRDAAASAPHMRHARTIDETGRGLFIVSSVAEQWGARFEEGGKTVWAQQLTEASRQSA
ncbi:SpoIIE family protein phosphatase [Streptacidiphilus griseoplanus]|uniref:SpoIIE family protein phosphatase n=1 Tax=Peterkaempfera griseoplana TaxID=66896 RepID=UPI0006E315E8|nr:SpoIIE family protein phosphatase [Peterkaempfera griseoplana]